MTLRLLTVATLAALTSPPAAASTDCASEPTDADKIACLTAWVDTLSGYLSADPVAHDVVFEGANVHVRSGSGFTDDSGSPTGLGNLLVGYDEDDGGDTKTGSHNLVLGSHHSYTGYGGLVAGHNNALAANHATVSGGRTNTASGSYASVSGGYDNTASAAYEVLP